MSSKHSLEDLFVIEKETHLTVLIQNIEQLRLEGYSDTIVKKMFRAAHSLKGAARLVNKDQVEKQAHELEEVLKRIEEEKSITKEGITKITECLGNLGLNIPRNVKDSETSSSNLLHISSGHISELIQLASELAVLTKRIDGESALSGHGSNSSNAQRASFVASLLQRLTYRLRLSPLHEVTGGLPTIANKLAEDLNKNISLKIFNSNTLIDRELLSKIEPCLIQLLKNALDHGVDSAEERLKSDKPKVCQIIISAKQCGTSVELEFSDDGRGVALDEIRDKIVAKGLHDKVTTDKLSKEELLEFLFLPGFSTRDSITTLSGRGIGLDIVKSTLRDLGGDVTIKTGNRTGTTFCLKIPSRIASFRALIFRCSDNFVGVPLCFVDRILGAGEARIVEVCGHLNISLSNEEIPLADGAQSFKLGNDMPRNTLRPIVVLQVQDKKLALLVDSLEEEREVVIHPLDRRYQKIEKVIGIAGGFGEKLVTIVNPELLLSSAIEGMKSNSDNSQETTSTKPVSKVLIVDDSLTVRELERRLLVQNGFDCEVAVDGLDGLEKLTQSHYSMVITDIDMPRLNGFELIEQIREQQTFQKLPLLVVSYKERIEDKERALALGANGYLSKGSFKDDSFVQTVRRLLEGQSET